MKIRDLAVLIQGAVDGDGEIEIKGLSGAGSAQAGDLTFAQDEHRLSLAENSLASCILTSPSMRASVKTIIRVKNPKLAFLFSYRLLFPLQTPKPFIHPSAEIDRQVSMGKNVYIGARAVVQEGAVIGDNTIIEAGCVIQENSSIGSSCHLHPGVILYPNAILKDNVILHAGVVVGCDGFGYLKDKGNIYKFPQLGKVIIEDNVEIGANTTIDRGSLGDTVIGSNTKIDNLCHIAHNVRIGRNILMAAQCGIAGSSVIKDDVTLSGQIAVTDNVTIGKNATIGGKSAVIGNIDDNEVVWGVPARPIGQVKKQLAVLSWLTKNYPSISKLLKQEASSA